MTAIIVTLKECTMMHLQAHAHIQLLANTMHLPNKSGMNTLQLDADF